MNDERESLILELLGRAALDLIPECLAARKDGLDAKVRPDSGSTNARALAVAVAHVVGTYNALAVAGLVHPLDSPAMLDAIESQRLRTLHTVETTIRRRPPRTDEPPPPVGLSGPGYHRRAIAAAAAPIPVRPMMGNDQYGELPLPSFDGTYPVIRGPAGRPPAKPSTEGESS